MSSVRIDANGRETHQVSVWLPIDVIRLIRADRLNLTRFILEQLELFYGLDAGMGDREHRDRLAAAAQAAFEQQRQAQAEVEADRERARSVVRQMRADRDVAQARQDGIADALLQMIGDDPTGRYLRTLPENDLNGDRMDDWEALVRRVSRLCGAEIDSAEVAAGVRALVAKA